MARAAIGDDRHLVDRCLDGDEAAWAALVRKYQSFVFTVALNTGLDEEAAGEVFQETWTELHRSLHRVRDPKALPRWLSVATRRLAYRYATRRNLWVEGVFEEMVDPEESVDDQVEKLQLSQRVSGAIEALGEPCTTLLRLLFYHDPPLSYDEIAERADISRGSIGPNRSRCLERLRTALGARR